MVLKHAKLIFYTINTDVKLACTELQVLASDPFCALMTHIWKWISRLGRGALCLTVSKAAERPRKMRTDDSLPDQVTGIFSV